MPAMARMARSDREVPDRPGSLQAKARSALNIGKRIRSVLLAFRYDRRSIACR